MISNVQLLSDSSVSAAIGMPAETRWQLEIDSIDATELWFVWWDRQSPGWSAPNIPAPPQPPYAYLSLDGLTMGIVHDFQVIQPVQQGMYFIPNRVSGIVSLNPGGGFLLELVVRSLVATHPTGLLWQPSVPVHFRFLSDRNDGIATRLTQGASAYSQAHRLHSTLFVSTGGIMQQFELKGLPSTQKYLSVGLEEAMKFEFVRNSLPVSNLSSDQDTILSVSLVLPENELPIRTLLYSFRESNTSRQESWMGAISFEALTIIEDGIISFDDFVLPLSDIIMLSDGFVNEGMNCWSFQVQIPAEMVAEKKCYMAVWETNSGNSYSDRTEVLETSPCAEICPPEISGGFADYTSEWGNWIQAAPTERIRSCLQIQEQSYDVCREKPWAEALKAIRFRISFADSTHNHILEEHWAYKQSDGNWQLPAKASFEQTGPKSSRVCFNFELRNQPELVNLQSILKLTGVASAAPLSNQNWTGRSLLIEYLFSLAQDQPVQMTDDVRYFQRIDVGSLELPNDIVFHGSNGFPVSMLCSDESLLEACLSTGIFASEQVQLQLSGSDGSLVSFDPLAGNFEQRSDSVFVDVPALTTDGRLCVKVNPLFLEEDSTYDLVFILNGQG